VDKVVDNFEKKVRACYPLGAVRLPNNSLPQINIRPANSDYAPLSDNSQVTRSNFKVT
jgi:hypothetical protein